MRNFSEKTRPLCLKMLVCFLAFSLSAIGRSQTMPIEGIRTNTPQVHALVNARIVQKPDQVIEKGTMVIRNGIIEAVGAEVLPPPDARVWDYEGLIVYPGLIEMYTHLGLRKEEKPDRRGPKHWNSRVRPEKNTADLYQPTQKDLDRIRALGFTTALITPDEGIFRGTSTLVSLGTVPQMNKLSGNALRNISPSFGREGPPELIPVR